MAPAGTQQAIGATTWLSAGISTGKDITTASGDPQLTSYHEVCIGIRDPPVSAPSGGIRVGRFISVVAVGIMVELTERSLGVRGQRVHLVYRSRECIFRSLELSKIKLQRSL